MQTNKKYVKKHIKKTKKKYVSKKNKQFLCYKIRFYNSFKGHVVGGAAQKISVHDKNKLVSFLKTYLKYILNGEANNDNDIHKYLNDILNDDDNLKNVNKSYSITTINKTYDKAQLLEDIYTELKMEEYFNNETNETKDTKDTKYKELTNFLEKKTTSQKTINNIKEQLIKLLEDKKITQNKYDSIIRQLDGISIISSSLAKINKSANSFGKWLSPEQFEQQEDNSEKKNEQTIKFLWYPRKHINYRKGSSMPKSYSKDDKYGDFMIYIDSPKYTDIGEYFKTSYNSVEDLFANILAGCDDMFCTRGNVKPTFYNSRLFIIKDKIIQDTK